MAALSHGIRQALRQGVLHIPPKPTLVSQTRSLFSRLLAQLTPPRHSIQPSLARPIQFSNSQPINARFSLPVKHALSRPFAPPRLPKPPAIPQNVTHVGLGTARAFHSGRPIFQNMVDNVPIATRALWEAEWDVKMKKKEARKMRRLTENKGVPKSEQMLNPNSMPLITETQSELDFYFPPEPTPAVTTHLLVPLAPTPTARLPLSTHSDGGGAHPLLPISDLAYIHSSHRLHSLRVSTLFARLDSANVWDDPGVNVDAYAFGPRHDADEKQCTILRVMFRGWNTSRVRAILGDSTEEWYSLQETQLDGHPTPASLPDVQQDACSTMHPKSPPTESAELDSYQASEVGLDDESDVLPQLPTRASASAQHDLVLPTLDFSSTFSIAANNSSPPPQPVIFLRTVSELAGDAEPASLAPFSMSSSRMDESWEYLGLSSSLLEHVEEGRRF